MNVEGNSQSGKLDRIDAAMARLLARHGIMAMRFSLGIVFLWFGALKLFPGMSPAEGLAGATIETLTLGLVKPAVSVPLLGIWESLIGAGLLSGGRRWLRITLVVLLVQMAGTVTPLILFPGAMFVREPFVLTFEGQYIVKNLVLVSGALIIWATARGGRIKPEPTGEYLELASLTRG